MIRNYLLITLRSLMKNKVFIFINVLGLAVGIACCIVSYFNWEFNAEFDHHHANADKIYRINSIREFEGKTTVYGIAPEPIGNVIRQNMPDVNHVVRMSWSWSNLKKEDDLFPVWLAYADPEFFSVFSFSFMAGKPADLKDRSVIFVSDELANKLFGSTDVVGRQLTQVLGSKMKEIIIAGVFHKQPANSSFREDAYMSYEAFSDEAKEFHEDDWKNRNTVFIEIDDPARVGTVRQSLQKYTENNNVVREDFQIREYVLDPFAGMAVRDEAEDVYNSRTHSASPTAAVVAPVMMAVLVLLIACFNMTNTAIAISSRRLKEIGIRKVMGSMRAQIIAQFIGETAFICLVALLLGLVLGEVLLGAWNALWEEMKLTSHYTDNFQFLGFLVGVLAFTALLAGSYPAFYISGFEPVSILKGKLKFGGTNYFTRVLLALQYAISLVGIIFAVAFYQNSLFQRAFDLGFDQESVIIAYVDSRAEYETYRNALLQNKDILSVAGSKHSVFSSRYNDPVKYESKQLEVDIIDVGDNYLQTMGLTLTKGRDFVKDSETDRKEAAIVTEQFAAHFGWKDPIGKEILWMDTVKLYVIGVVKDVYTKGLWREMDPLMIRYTSPDNYTHVIVKAPAEKLSDINGFMEKQWKDVFPNRLYNGRFLNEDLAEANTVNNNIVKMFAFLGIIALVLSATGLFTLVSLNIIKKMKEIGVRKVLGASISNITRIINTEFAVILLIASMLGSVLSYFAVDALMNSIWDYYQPTTGTALVLSVFVMLTVSAIAVGYKVFSAASMNPVSTLRDE